MGISRKKKIDHTFLSGGSFWPEINASELHFGQSFQGYPTWPYLECGEQHLFYRKLAPSSIFHFLSSSFLVCCRREKNIGMNITLFAATVGSGFEETARQEKVIFCEWVSAATGKLIFLPLLIYQLLYGSEEHFTCFGFIQSMPGKYQ